MLNFNLSKISVQHCVKLRARVIVPMEIYVFIRTRRNYSRLVSTFVPVGSQHCGILLAQQGCIHDVASSEQTVMLGCRKPIAEHLFKLQTEYTESRRLTVQISSLMTEKFYSLLPLKFKKIVQFRRDFPETIIQICKAIRSHFYYFKILTYFRCKRIQTNIIIGLKWFCFEDEICSDKIKI
jgi:hypothetical protein